MSTSYCIVYVTASGSKEAERLSKALVHSKLAACVNTVPKVKSRYWWKGKMETAQESLLIIKTKKSLFPALAKKVKSLHSYTVPEIIALPIEQGHADYLNWIKESI